MGKTKDLSKDIGDKTIDQHQMRTNYKTIRNNFGEIGVSNRVMSFYGWGVQSVIYFCCKAGHFNMGISHKCSFISKIREISSSNKCM